MLSESGHNTGLGCLELHFGNLTGLRADNCLAAAVTAIGVRHHRRDDKVKAKGSDSGDEYKHSIHIEPPFHILM
jgi:hypothetical protein